MSDRTYPLPPIELGNDPRFTFGLTYDICGLLEAAGYPPIRGADHVELMQALYRFLYEVKPFTVEELAERSTGRSDTVSHAPMPIGAGRGAPLCGASAGRTVLAPAAADCPACRALLAEKES